MCAAAPAVIRPIVVIAMVQDERRVFRLRPYVLDSIAALQVGIPFFVFAGINMYAFYHMFGWAGVLPPVLFMMGGIIEGALLPATIIAVGHPPHLDHICSTYILACKAWRQHLVKIMYDGLQVSSRRRPSISAGMVLRLCCSMQGSLPSSFCFRG